MKHKKMRHIFFASICTASMIHATIKKEQFSSKTIRRWNQLHKKLFQEIFKEKIDIKTGLATIVLLMRRCGARGILNDEGAMYIANDLMTKLNMTEKPASILSLIQQELWRNHSTPLYTPKKQIKLKSSEIMKHNIRMIKENTQLNPVTGGPYIKASMILYAYIKQMQESNCLVRFLIQYDWGIRLLRWWGVL